MVIWLPSLPIEMAAFMIPGLILKAVNGKTVVLTMNLNCSGKGKNMLVLLVFDMPILAWFFDNIPSKTERMTPKYRIGENYICF